MSGSVLPHSDKEDLQSLRAGGGNGAVYVGAGFVLGLYLLLLSTLFASFLLVSDDAEIPFRAENTHALTRVGERWAIHLSEDIESYRGWLTDHGTAAERGVFERVADLLAGSALSATDSPEESLLSAVYISAHTGATRLVFLVVASFRLWVICFIGALFLGYASYRPYIGDDLLGQTGNGRLFYSGARAGLDRLSASGAPDILVRGVACPSTASRGATRASPVWRVLGHYSATNDTNEALASIIVAHETTAPFVARGDEEHLLTKSYTGSSLLEHAASLLEKILELHRHYAAGNTSSHPHAESESEAQSGPYSYDDYALIVSRALHKVLLPHQRALLGELSTAEIATFVLALESGKVLAHSTEGGKWFRASNYPHLSARAVLHSVVHYPREYDFESRGRVRQAFVNAARTSAFAPVRMPQGMSEESWALRQWAEILLAAPYDLASVVDEVELAGLVRGAHRAWTEEVLPNAFTHVPDLSTTSFATPSDLFFIPLGSLVALLKRAIPPESLSRLATLGASIGAKQRRIMERAQQAEEGSGSLLYDRVFPAIPQDSLIALASLHSLQPRDLADWSALRNILAPFGWLARRVGDYTVPESSIIFSVFKAPKGYPLANALGLVGKTGLVPLRKSKFEETCGREWERRFQIFQRATMSESSEDFEKLLRGIQEESIEGVEGITPPPSQQS